MALGACGVAPDGSDSPGAPIVRGEEAPSAAEEEAAEEPAGFPEVPPVVLTLADGEVPLRPWTFCLEGGCADGMRPEDPYDVGSPGSVEFSFERAGWEFEATFTDDRDADCPRAVTTEAEATSPTTFRLEPAGPAGAWTVDLFGRKDGEGDVVVSFDWTTPVDGTMPDAATGVAAVLADHDGALDSYGVEVSVRDLAFTPAETVATMTVTSAVGEAVVIDLAALGDGCIGAGALYLTASPDEGRRATLIGDGPFTYRVDLVLDGVPYVGVGTWPDGVVPELEPFVPLTWTPELPVYRG